MENDLRRWMRLVEMDDPDYDDPDRPWQQRWKKIVTLRAGTVLYHGTDQRYVPDQITGPAWFTTERKVATYFAKREGNKGRVVTYRLVQDLMLPKIENKRDFDNFAEMFYIDRLGVEDMRDSIKRSSLPGWYIPNNYNPGDDILIADLRALAPKTR